MILLDANILLYAHDTEAVQHRAVRKWLESCFAGDDWIGLPWVSLWAFVRVSSNPRLLRRPLSSDEAFEIVRSLLAQPRTVIVQPGERHAELLERMVREGQAAGPLVTDAVLAALALEHGATLASTDRDFSRFPMLDWVNPLEAVSR